MVGVAAALSVVSTGFEIGKAIYQNADRIVKETTKIIHAVQVGLKAWKSISGSSFIGSTVGGVKKLFRRLKFW